MSDENTRLRGDLEHIYAALGELLHIAHDNPNDLTTHVGLLVDHNRYLDTWRDLMWELVEETELLISAADPTSGFDLQERVALTEAAIDAIRKHGEGKPTSLRVKDLESALKDAQNYVCMSPTRAGWLLNRRINELLHPKKTEE
jgi:hypothetical protein